jgi:hypothetical protein
LSHYDCYDCVTRRSVNCNSGGSGPILQPADGDGTGLLPTDPIDQPAVCRTAVYTYTTTTRNGSFIPVEGIKVRVRRYFNTKVGYTNSEGKFNITHSFNGDVNYLIVWENSMWDIRDGNLTQAYLNGPQQGSPWIVKIGGLKSLRFATIHRACFRYYYQNIDGLQRPYFGGKMKINYNDGEGTGVNWGVEWQNIDFGTGLLPNIKIWGKNDDGLYRPTNQIFSTTIHELAHTSHISLLFFGLVDLAQVADIVRESWADAVEWHVTRLEYVDRGIGNYDDPDLTGPDVGLQVDNSQRWRFNGNRETNDIYTPLFIDLIDDYNQAAERNNNNMPTDNITGFSMRNIERNILPDAYGLTSLRQALRNNRPAGTTEVAVNNYMAQYFNRLDE